jgi:hypothetical protein
MSKKLTWGKVMSGLSAFPQRHIREDFRGTTDDGRVAIDTRIAREHADLVGAELIAQIEEFLVYQRLDRGGVNRALPPAQGAKVHRGGDQRFARPGRRIEDHMLSRHHL